MSKQESFEKTYFTTKGAIGEAFVHDLAEKSIFTDWCYKNPMLKPGKELCDLLVVFDNMAIIVQVKDLKLKSSGAPNVKAQQTNIKQILGAYRQLMKLKTPVTLHNVRQGDEPFDPDKIDRVFLISILTGEGSSDLCYQQVDDNIVHIFDRDFTEIVLNELDTVADLLLYLDQKELLIANNKSLSITGSEKDLLAYFINQKRDLREIKNATDLIIMEGIWDDYTNADDVIAKRQADSISYAWDRLIDISHTSGGEYERIAREFARLNRFQRRIYGEALIDGFEQAQKGISPKVNTYRRVMGLADQKLTVVICYYNDPSLGKEKLRGQLLTMAEVARCILPDNPKVIGIGSDLTANFSGSFTFLYLEQPELTKEYVQRVKELQQQHKIFISPQYKAFSADEYPSAKKP